jgi:NAD(P)-dependent dehydrogenase (short-subunit alcohol dehydrogenase family)
MADRGADIDRGAVVVTGTSTGIGRAAAKRLAREGFRVFAGVRKDTDAESIRGEGIDGLEPVMIDVSDEDSIGSARKQVEQAVGDEGLAGLVNNAGTAIPGPLEFLPLQRIRDQLEINLIGQIAVTQAFLPLLRKARGRIVNIASVGGRVTFPFNAPYHLSKHAMEAFSDALRLELQPWEIEVSCVEPGSIATEIWDTGASHASATRESMGAEGERLYAKGIDAATRRSAKAGERGISPDKVADAIEDALTAARPKTRYLVGTDAKIMARARRILGDRRWDRVVTQQMKLPKRGSAKP